MLTHLYIRHFAIIDVSELAFTNGMTALTGETGAGKSILLDALALVTGARASSDAIQQGAKRADITARFNLDKLPQVRQWLETQQLDAEQECLIRRTLLVDGKSRATINDIPVSVKSLQALGEQLVTLHGQHAHQTLTKSSQQRSLLDRQAGGKYLQRVETAWKEWKEANDAVNEHAQLAHERLQRIDLLRFQLQEFDTLDIGRLRIEDIESEHRWLASSEQLMALGEKSLSELDDTAYPALNRATTPLSELVRVDERLREALDLVESAVIQVAESSQLIRSTLSRLERDDARLQWLDDKLSLLHGLARKHQCQMADLPALEQRLRDEYDAICDPGSTIEQLEQTRDALRQVYDGAAAALGRHRRRHAGKLAKTITDTMQELGMAGGRFEIQVQTDDAQPAPQGNDAVTFLVSTNPGVAEGQMSRIASGGELSRISLCMTLAALDTQAVPTLVFDEVDAGVGGAVATTVGQMLRRVGERTQVLCVTHLPQVAAQAHGHLFINKSVNEGKTQTDVQALTGKAVRDEIARMLGGRKLTTKSRQHAQEMLDAARAPTVTAS